jgi:hypothetical protein
LLEGSGYNVLMIGDQGEGTPRQILLSSPNGKSAKPAATVSQPGDSDSDDDADVENEEQPQPPQQPPSRNGLGQGAPPRTPQQEMQQRQQQPQDHNDPQ